MRFAPLLAFLVFAFSLAAHGQEQESRIGGLFHLPFGKGKTAKVAPPVLGRGDQLIHPDETKAFNLDSLKFSSGKTISNKGFVDSHAVKMKEFQFDQKFAAKEFNSHEYGGAKNAWMGKMKFSTKTVDTTGKYQIPNVDKTATSKVLPVKDYVDKGKKTDTKAYADARPYLKHAKGAAGGMDHFVDNYAMDPNQQTVGWSGKLDKMTIDDVRTLLNKNK